MKPQTQPATRAAITSIKFSDQMCTRAYTSATIRKEWSAAKRQRCDSRMPRKDRCTKPRQKNSSAGPITNSNSSAIAQAGNPSFIE